MKKDFAILGGAGCEVGVIITASLSIKLKLMSHTFIFHTSHLAVYSISQNCANKTPASKFSFFLAVIIVVVVFFVTGWALL